MPNAPVNQAQLYQHSAELLGIHEALLRDEPRNRAFQAALASQVTPDSVVLDIGAGTGLWAILAAKLGARRVVAVEREPLMCGMIQSLARANGVADRVEVVQGDALQVGLSRDFDIVISETIGHMIFDEDIVPVMIDARNRFLKPGGTVIPEEVALLAAPVHLMETRAPWPVGIELDYSPFESVALHRPVPYLDKSGFRFLADPATLIATDLELVATPPDLTRLAASWEIADSSNLTGIAVWVRMRLSGDHSLSTLDTPSWSATLYRLGPFHAASGRLDFQLELNRDTNFWSAALGGQQQRFSPAIAATVLALPGHATVPLFPQFPIHGGGPVRA